MRFCVCLRVHICPPKISKPMVGHIRLQTKKNCQPASWNRKNMGKFKVPLGNPEVVGLKKELGTEPSKLWGLNSPSNWVSWIHGLMFRETNLENHRASWQVTTSHFPISNFRDQRFKPAIHPRKDFPKPAILRCKT